METIAGVRNPDTTTDQVRSSSIALVRRFAYRRHSNPRIIAWNPTEREVGWHFTAPATGECRFVKWGSTKNDTSLAGLIADVQLKHGPLDVLDLDTPNAPTLARAGEDAAITNPSPTARCQQ